MVREMGVLWVTHCAYTEASVALTGGKKKPLKQPKKQQQDMDEVREMHGCMVTLIDREGTISTERCIDIEKLWLVTQILVPLMSGPPEANTSTYWSMWNLQRNVFKSACQHIKKVLKLWKHAKVYTNTANKEFKCLKYLYFIALHIRMLQEPGFCWATYLSAACSMAFLQITCLCFYFHCILRESWFSYS